MQISDDADNWQTIYSVRGAQSSRQYISTPDSEATHIRIDGARSITLQPTSWSATPNDFFANVARDAPRPAFREPVQVGR